jgi:spermidine synthase
VRKIRNRIAQVLSFLYPITIEIYSSAISGVIALTYEYGRLVVNTSEANYSYGSLHRVFRSAMKQMKFIDQPAKVLILGFGAGSIAKILVEEYQLPVEIDGVEIDPVMLQIHEEYFKLDTNQLTLYNQDALIFLEQNTSLYDYIFIDIFDNLDVPENLLNKSFIELLQKHSSARTQIAMNTMLTEDHPFLEEWKRSFGKMASNCLFDESNLVLFVRPSTD